MQNLTPPVARLQTPSAQHLLLSIDSVSVIIAFWLILFFSTNRVNAQRQAWLQPYLEVWRSGKVPTPVISPDLLNNAELLTSIQPFLNDSTLSVSRGARQLLTSLAINSSDRAIRQRATNLLVGALTLTGENESLVYSLRQFQPADFAASARDTLAARIRQSPTSMASLIRLAGYIDLAALRDFLRSQSTPQNSNKKVRWAALLALARMGDEQATAAVLQQVKKQPMGDQVVENLFPDLVYTRQRLALDYLGEILSNETPLCTSLNPELTDAIDCGYRVMEMLALVIRDFPLKLGTMGDIETNDYERALAQARQWWRGHQYDYVILNETY